MRKAIFALLAFPALSVCAAVFHVDSAAAPGGDGSAGRPLPTLLSARDALRAARMDGRIGKREKVEVLIAPGDYELAESLEFDGRDGGDSETAPVVWRAEKPGAVRISGGRKVPSRLFAPVGDAAVLSRLPENARKAVLCADVSGILPGTVAPMEDMFDALPAKPLLFAGRRFGVLARWPNEGYASFSEYVDHGEFRGKRRGSVKMYSPGAFVFSDPRAKRWDFAGGVWMNGYWTHDWHNCSVRAASYGAEGGTNDVIRLAADIPYGIMGKTWGDKARRFYVFNMLEELDAPGEWYLDRERKILYLYPLQGRPADGDIVLAMLETPLVSSAKRVFNLRFENIAFEYTYGDAVSLSGSGIQLVNCRISCCGSRGVVLSGERNLMRGCEVFLTGREAVRVAGGDRKTLSRADSVFEGNHVHDYAVFQRTYAPGFHVSGCGMVLRGNVIHDAPHCAIIYGGNEHLFEYNNVYRVLLETGDAGAYYTGRDWTTQGNVLRYNYTHDLGPGTTETKNADEAVSGANTMGFYFDDCDCGDEVYGNVFHNIARGILVGGGRDHPIRNNVFSRCAIGISIDCRGMRWRQWNNPKHGGASWMLENKAKVFDYTNGLWAARYPNLANIMNDHPREPLHNPVVSNIFIGCSSQLVLVPKKAPLSRMAPIAGNFAINPCGTNGVVCAQPDKRLRSGFTILNGSAESPDYFGFADPPNGDFRLLPGADILKIASGFVPIPFERIPAARSEKE